MEEYNQRRAIDTAMAEVHDTLHSIAKDEDAPLKHRLEACQLLIEHYGPHTGDATQIARSISEEAEHGPRACIEASRLVLQSLSKDRHVGYLAQIRTYWASARDATAIAG